MTAPRYTMIAEIEVEIDEHKVAYPQIKIVYNYSPGRPAYTPRGEYAPIDPPDPPEVGYLYATLYKDDGLNPTQQQIEQLAIHYLDSDDGFNHACNNAEDCHYATRNVR